MYLRDGCGLSRFSQARLILSFSRRFSSVSFVFRVPLQLSFIAFCFVRLLQVLAGIALV
jgi:hypothetical protein